MLYLLAGVWYDVCYSGFKILISPACFVQGSNTYQVPEYVDIVGSKQKPFRTSADAHPQWIQMSVDLKVVVLSSAPPKMYSPEAYQPSGVVQWAGVLNFTHQKTDSIPTSDMCLYSSGSKHESASLQNPVKARELLKCQMPCSTQNRRQSQGVVDGVGWTFVTTDSPEAGRWTNMYGNDVKIGS